MPAYMELLLCPHLYRLPASYTGDRYLTTPFVAWLNLSQMFLHDEGWGRLNE